MPTIEPKRRHHYVGLYMVIPVIGIMLLSYGVFLVFPVCYAVLGSLFDWNPLHNKFNFIGLGNYVEALTYSLTGVSMYNTVLFAVVVVTVRTAIGLIFAVLIDQVKRLKSFFRTIYYLPVVTSMVAVAMLWRNLLYNPAFGLLNQLLTSLGLHGSMWLKSPDTALFSIMLTTIWKDAGYAVVLYLAGLQNIPRHLIEAATIDGAGRFRTFWNITLPLLRSTTLLVIVTATISYLQVFTQIFIMSDPTGGPGTSTYTMAYYLYNEAFVKYRFGYASALAVILFVVIMSFSLIQMRLTRRMD